MKGGVAVGQHKIHVHVVPGSGKFSIVGWDTWRNALTIKLKNPAEGGKANKELVGTLSKIVGYPVEIISGHKSRDKVLAVQCDDKEFEEILKKLAEYEKG